MREALRCPACRGELGDRRGQLVCAVCRLVYPVRDGIPSLLAGRASELEESE
ncbi:MAG: Trm112 family protein [Bifidobacteriaceae bacterium]|nr:Trm112 family protein [Bifidobacteriaceae bacterium]